MTTGQKRIPPCDDHRAATPLAVLPALRPAPAPGLPLRQGAVLAILWQAHRPLSTAQISIRLAEGSSGTGIGHALHQLRAARLITATWAGRAHRYAPALDRDAYLAALVAAALDQAADPAAVLRTALPGSP